MLDAADITMQSPIERPPLPRVRPANAPPPIEPISRQELCDAVASSAHQHRLPIAFFGNLIYQESSLRPRLVSRAGARGIAQFMPKTARLIGLKDPFNPRQALPASAKFLRGLLYRFGYNYGLAAAAYNGGPTRISRWVKRGGALPHETRNYVVKITGKRVDQWRGAHAYDLAHDLREDMPCPNLRAFAELQDNPASAHSLRPKFVLPMPLPNPLRPLGQVALAGEAEPQLTVNIDMTLPAVSPDPPATQPGDPPTGSITIALSSSPQGASAEEYRAVESVVALIAKPPTPRPAPRRANEHEREPMVTMSALIKKPPMPRARPVDLAQTPK